MSDQEFQQDENVEATETEVEAGAEPPTEVEAEASNEAAPTVRELTDAERAQLAELQSQIAKFEAAKRWSDVIKCVLQQAEIVQSPESKAACFRNAGNLYIERSSNQAEAIKCFEKVLEFSPDDAEAVYRLKELYEKRRDWEGLIRIMQRETEMLPPEDRALRYVEMADLATQRLRKPEVSITLWEKVLETEPTHADALNNLAQLYERQKEFEKLAHVLEALVDQTSAEADLKNHLIKLGGIYADKTNDDEGAVRAYRRLLAIDPDDRRAQEQLKKRYVILKAWDDLEEFYAPSEKWDELIRLIEKEADDANNSVEERIALQFRVARLWREKKDKLDRAARAFEKVLDLDANNLEAAEALSPIYEAANDAKKLVGVYEVRLKHVDDPDGRIALLREAGLLYEERLKQAPTAFERYLEAFSISPTTEIVREDVERVAPVVNGWDRVIAAYTKAISEATEEESAIELRLQLGRVLWQVERIEDAIAQFRAVYDAQGDHPDAIAALAELYRSTAKYSELLGIYDRRIELEHDADTRRLLAYERAGLFEHELGDAEHAVEAYQAIITEYGDEERDAYAALDGLFEKGNKWQDLADTLQRRIDLGPPSDEELASLKFRLGRVFELHLARKADGVALMSEVLTLVPEHEGARLALEELLSDAEVGVSAARILEPVYEGREDWPNLIRALRVLHDGSSSAEERLELLTKAGLVHAERIGDADKAFDTFAEAFREAPESTDTLARLEMIAVEREAFPRLVTLVQELAGKAEDPDLARTLWIKAAQIQDAQLGDVDGAVAAYLKVLELDAGDAEVLSALEELYRRTNRHRDLVGILRRRFELTSDGSEQEGLLAQMASIHDQALSEPNEAIRLHKEILEIDPASPRALGALDDLFQRLEMWGDLADNVDRQLTLATDPDQQIGLMIRLAQLRETRMNATEAAIDIYRQVLERDSTQPDALAALERLLQVPQHQVVIAEILEPIYQGANEYAKLIGVHEIQATHASSPERRVELLHRIAELYEVALDDAPSAFSTMARALAEDPANATTQEQIERLAALTGAYEALAKTYEERIEQIEDVQLKVSLHVKAAEVRETQLQDYDGAIAHYKKVLELDETQLDSASALERLYTQLERWPQLAAINLTKAKMLPSLDEQKEHLFRAAQIHEETLENPDDAITVYRQVLELDPEDIPALDKLIEIHLRLERWEPLLEVYTRKADIVDDTDEKKALYVQVGAVYESELKNVEKAIDTYQRILEIDPQDMTAIQRLDVLYQSTQNWQELLSVLEREADLADDPDEVIGLRYRIAELWHRKLGDPSRAVEIYRDILETQPDHKPTLDALESMIDEKLVPVASALVLDGVYRASGEAAKLVRVLEVQIANEEDPVRRVDLLHQVGVLQEEQLDDVNKAFDAYGRALPSDNRNEDTIANIERLAERTNRWNDVVRLYDVEIEKLRTEAPADVVDLALRAAVTYETRVGDVDTAIQRYVLVTEADPAHTQAIESLDRLYEQTQRWPELAKVLETEINGASDPDQSLEFQYRLGQVAQHYLGDVDRAIGHYRDILNAAPDHAASAAALEGLLDAGVRPVQITEILEPLYRMQENWERLLSLHEVQLHFIEGGDDRVGLMHRMVEIAETQAGDASAAAQWMQRALLENPSDEQSITECERLAGALNEWSQLADTYAEAIESTQSAEAKVDLGRRLARVYEEELGDVDRAEETFRFVLSVQPTDEDSLVALDRIYVANGSYESLADILRRRIAIAQNKDDSIELHYRLATVLEDALGRTDEAVVALSHVITELDPEHLDSVRKLQAIHLRRADYANLFAAFDKETQIVFGDTQRAELLSRMARIASEQLKDDERSVALWRQVLDIRGEDLEALNAIGAIYERQKNWRDLADILEREATEARAQGQDNLAVSAYSDLARIWYGKLENSASALEAWEKVLEVDPQHVEALEAITEIHRRANEWSDVTMTLHRIVDGCAAVMEGPALERVFMQLAYVYQHRQEQPMDAADAYKQALDVNPRNFEALAGLELIYRADMAWEDVISVMERRVTAFDDPQQKIDQLLAIAYTWEKELENPDKGTSAFQRILQIAPLHDYAFERLQELHRDARRWDDLGELYITRFENEADPKDQVVLLRQAADVYEKNQNDIENAYNALESAWQLDFTDRVTVNELERVTGLANKWNELLTTANGALGQAEDPKIKIAICLACAKWYGSELKHPDYAIPYYQQIMAIDPENVPAMQQMAELYRSTSQWPMLAQVLGRLVESTKDSLVLADTYTQMGDLAQTHLGVPEQAPGFYTKAIEHNAAAVPAMKALEGIYRSNGQWSELLDVLHKKVKVLEEFPEVIETKLQIAETYEDRTREANKAIDTYNQVLADEPSSLRALKGLERLYSQSQRWTDLLGVLERELDVVTTERERISTLSWMASMQEEEFLKPDKAAERLEEVIDIAPNHEPALVGLERLYRAMLKWDDLIRTYERHVGATPERGVKIRCFKSIGDVYAKELNDVDHSIDAYLNVLDIDEKDAEALDALARLYTKRGDHSQALDMMGQLSKLVTDPAQQVELKFRMGQVLDKELGDRVGAIDQYRAATDIEPAHLPSLEAMRKIHMESGDWVDASRVLEQEAKFSENNRTKAARLVDLGKLHDDQLDEHDVAISYYEKALDADEDNEDAAMPLVQEYTEKNRLGEAFPLLKMLVKRSTNREPAEQHRFAYLLGDVALKLGDHEEAAKAFVKANTLDAQDIPTLVGLASSYFELKDWEKASKFLQNLLMHRDALGSEQYTDILYRLGVTKREQGEKAKALNFFDKALAEDSSHVPTLEALIGLYDEQKNWEQVANFQKQILDNTFDSDERFRRLGLLGDVYKDKLKNPQKAIQAYSEASDIKPEDHRLLHELLTLYQETAQYQDMLDTIDRILKITPNAVARSKQLYTQGTILVDLLKDSDAAIDKYNAALDADPDNLRAFEKINKIITAKKDWKNLERAYRKMLHRIIGKGKTDLEYTLWEQLGLIYRDRQKNLEAAAEAFRMAVALKPDDAKQHIILAELYTQLPARVGDAIAEHQWLLKQDPYRVDSYTALYKLYFDARAYDKAWCVAAALSFFKKADNEIQQFHQQYKPQTVPQAASRLSNEAWIRDLFAPEEDRYISKMMEILAVGVLAVKAQQDKDLGLAKEKPVEIESSTVPMVRALHTVKTTLNIPLPIRLFLLEKTPGGLQDVVGSQPPAIRAGNTLLTGQNPSDLNFILGRHLAYYRPEHFIRVMMKSHTELRVVLLAGLRLAGLGAADPQVDATAQALAQGITNTAHLDALRAVARKFIETGAPADIKKWMMNVELTALRAGLLVSGDLDAAARVVPILQTDASVDMPPKDKLKELVLFSVSEEYFRLREALGIQIRV